MKQFYKTFTSALTAILLMTACGNAGAQNEKKDVKGTHTQAVAELDAAQFDEKAYDMDAEGL